MAIFENWIHNQGQDMLKYISIIDNLFDRIGSENVLKLIPDMLWVSRQPESFDLLVHDIAQYFKDRRIINFQGDSPYIWISPKYDKNYDALTECGRINDIFTLASGFKEHFNGIVCVDCQNWIHHFKDITFSRIIQYICDCSKNSLVIFMICTDSEKECQTIEETIRTLCNLSVISFDSMNQNSQYIYIKAKLEEFGMHIDNKVHSRALR